MKEKIYEVAYKYALKNAVEHEGKAEEKAVMAKVFIEVPEARKDVDLVRKIVEEAVSEVNKKSLEEQKKELEKFSFVRPEKKEKKVEGPVVTRFAVEPGGRIHLGNLRAAFANYFFARENDGKFILRIDDTNPEKVRYVYYSFLEEDLKECGIKWDEKFCQSERFEEYYKHMRKLLEMGKAYFSFLSPKELRELRRKGAPPPEREKPLEFHLETWDKVFENAYDEGEVVLLLASDPGHKNPVLREPAIGRIITSVPHPLTGWKYIFYPTYNFASAVDDAEVTHVLRGKDHENNAKIQDLIREYLGLKNPETITFGRIKVEEGAIPLGKRYIREALLKNEIEGWGDVKIATVRSLLNRGIRKEALEAVFKEIKAKKTDISLPMEKIYAENRKLLDNVPRYFFVPDPVEIIVKNAPEVVAKIPFHPEKDLGHREYVFRKGEHKIFVSSNDLSETFRLLYLYNVVWNGEYAEYAGDNLEGRKIQWVPEYSIPAEILMPDGSSMKGRIEGYAEFLKPGDTIRLERVCFARVKVNEGEKIVLYWTHD